MTRKRRNTVPRRGAVTFFWVAALSLGVAPRAPAAGLPNIVVVLADDLGYGDVGVYNAGSKIPTPNLDQLARDGVRFTDAHAPSAVCTPTRYAILTGRYCWRTGTGPNVLAPFGETLIEPGRFTLPALLRSRGYRTAAIGKWHLGWRWPTTDGQPPANRANGDHSNVDFARPIADGPTTRGFDAYFGVDVPNYCPYVFIENDRTVGVPSTTMPASVISGPQPPHDGPLDLRYGPMLPGWDLSAVLPTITDHAVQFVQDRAAHPSDGPFFLYFALTGPHTPIFPTADYWNRSAAGPYGDLVAEVDGSVGRVLGALRATGLAGNTLVIFTSDNGPETMAYPRVRQYHHYSMGELRGIKRDTWEGGHRVPFIARWPGHVGAGTTSDEVISEVDLLSTLAAVAGAPVPADAAEDSFNVLPALLGQRLDRPIRDATVEHTGGAAGHFAIRRGDWLYIDYRTGDGNHEPQWFKDERHYGPDTGSALLYNLRHDPQERHDLLPANPAKGAELKALLEHIKAAGASRPGAQRPTIPPGPGKPASRMVGPREESDPD